MSTSEPATTAQHDYKYVHGRRCELEFDAWYVTEGRRLHIVGERLSWYVWKAAWDAARRDEQQADNAPAVDSK